MTSPRRSKPPKKAAGPAGAALRVPRTVSHPALLRGGSDEAFRQALYLMVLAFGRLQSCREAFGRAMGAAGAPLTGSQYAVLMGTAYMQETEGVSIRALAGHVQLAPPHVTTEVGRLIRKGLLTKRANSRDRRGVLVRLSRKGEVALLLVIPFVRAINDILFENVSRRDFEALSQFLRGFALNTERALAEVRRSERERGLAAPAPRRSRA